MSLELPTLVSQLMNTDVVCIEETASVSNLLEALQALHFRHLPVTDGRRLIGLLSERDLLRLAASNLLSQHSQQDTTLLARFRVRDVMVRDIVTVTPETRVTAAARLLLDKRIGCLPVVNSAHDLVGIVTSSDFIAALPGVARTS